MTHVMNRFYKSSKETSRLGQRPIWVAQEHARSPMLVAALSQLFVGSMESNVVTSTRYVKSKWPLFNTKPSRHKLSKVLGPRNYAAASTSSSFSL